MNNLTISVVIPTLNSAKTLESTLQSLQSQIDCEFNIIIVDSGSADGTLEICRDWDVPVHYVPKGNMYRAVNFGLRMCTTSWVTYLNSDDLVYPKSYSRLLKLGNKENAEVVYGNCDYIDSEGRFLHSFFSPYPHELQSIFKCGVFPFAQPATIFSKSLYSKLSGFNDYFLLTADADFFFKACANNYKFSYLSGKPVSCYRLSRNQLSKQTHIKHLEKMDRLADIESDFNDKFILYRWKLRNLPQYLIRIFRRYSILNKFYFPKITEV